MFRQVIADKWFLVNNKKQKSAVIARFTAPCFSENQHVFRTSCGT